jgi:hypothetical protein
MDYQEEAERWLDQWGGLGSVQRLTRCGYAAEKALGLDEHSNSPADVSERIDRLTAENHRLREWAVKAHGLCGGLHYSPGAMNLAQWVVDIVKELQSTYPTDEEVG